jgi:hypothetical protein
MTATDDLLKEISVKLDRMTKLLAASTIKGYGTEQEKIELLDSMGFTSTEIARLLNKSIQNVCVQLNLISKKKQKKDTKLETVETTSKKPTTLAENKE